MAEPKKQIPLRLNAKLYEALAAWAEDDFRSVNGHIHGYEDETKQVELTCDQNGQQLVVTVEDHGVGIEDLEQALQPFFTTKPELERSGMGFSFMEAFMDRIEVRSKKGEGTRVVMWKYIEREREQ